MTASIATLVVQGGSIVLIAAVAVVYLRSRLWQCPDCGIGNGADITLDYEHIAETTDAEPYCPYCGTQTEAAGRRYEYWLGSIRARLPGGERQ